MADRAKLFCALDRPDLDGAMALARRVLPHVDGLKVGLELFAASGPAGVRRIVAFGLPVFLDVKLHDIPNTVAGAMRAVAGLGVELITVHCLGGIAMLKAAVAAARAGARPVQVLGVTVLTSLDAADLAAAGTSLSPQAQALRLADLAEEADLDGIVCSPRELQALRPHIAPRRLLVVPGIRPAGSADGDQKRTLSPAEAVAVGADILVVGRPIHAAADPAAAARAIQAEMAGAVAA
jgi:orotidine-5'-phosphate decarboxylase